MEALDIADQARLLAWASLCACACALVCVCVPAGWGTQGCTCGLQRGRAHSRAARGPAMSQSAATRTLRVCASLVFGITTRLARCAPALPCRPLTTSTACWRGRKALTAAAACGTKPVRARVGGEGCGQAASARDNPALRACWRAASLPACLPASLLACLPACPALPHPALPSLPPWPPWCAARLAGGGVPPQEAGRPDRAEGAGAAAGARRRQGAAQEGAGAGAWGWQGGGVRRRRCRWHTAACTCGQRRARPTDWWAVAVAGLGGRKGLGRGKGRCLVCARQDGGGCGAPAGGEPNRAGCGAKVAAQRGATQRSVACRACGVAGVQV